MSKRIVVTGCQEEPYKGKDGVHNYCIPVHAAYAKSVGADFKFVKYDGEIEGRNLSWNKIGAIAKFMNAYDEVLFLDYDTTLIDYKMDLFEYLKTAPEVPGYTRDPKKPICLYATSDKPINTHLPSNAVFLLDARNKELARTFLNDWWNETKDVKYLKEHPYERTVLREVLEPHVRTANIQINQYLGGHQVFFRASPQYKNARISVAKRYFYAMMNPTEKKRVGVIVRQQNYYSNGAGQNCIFLAQTLEAMGRKVDLLIYDDRAKPNQVSDTIFLTYKDIKGINYAEYDLIVFGAATPTKEDNDKMVAAGVRRAMFNPCNALHAFHAENFIYKCKESSLPLFEMNFKDIADEIWLTDNHKESSEVYLSVINKNKIPVKTIPLTWSPLFLMDKGGNVSMYKPHTGPKMDIVIMEPNISACKSAWIPLVICEALFLKHPDKINKVYLFNSPTDNPTAKGMIESLELFKAKKIRMLQRLAITDMFQFFSDPKKNDNHQVVFLSHQEHVPLNYAYFDILSSGYAFVHNSASLGGLGYIYNDADINGGVKALLEAGTSHTIEEGLKKVTEYLEKKDPYHESVVAHMRAIVDKTA